MKFSQFRRMKAQGKGRPSKNVIYLFGVVGAVVILLCAVMVYFKIMQGPPELPISAPLRIEQQRSLQTIQKENTLHPADIRTMQGQWQADLEGNQLFLAVRGNQYNLVFWSDADGIARRYTGGTISTRPNEQGVFLFTPPENYSPPSIKGIRSRTITVSPYDVVVLMDSVSGDLYWVPYKKDYEIHPVFYYSQTADRFIKFTSYKK